MIYNFSWNVRNDQGNDDFEGYDHVLNKYSHKDNVGTIPELWVSLLQVLDQDWLFSQSDGI